MLRKILFPLLLGIAGVGVLLWLGFWQLDRLVWKEDILAAVDARLAAAPEPLTLTETEENDEYRAVTVSGTPAGEELHVLVSGTEAGTGYRVISAYVLDDGRRILLDQGLLPLEQKEAAPLLAPMQITGTLLWPDDQNDNTPVPDMRKNIWFARNVATMSEVLQTEPFLVVASSTPDPRLVALPITGATIKNDHLEYAITWFLLAVVWATMTAFLIYRQTRPKDA